MVAGAVPIGSVAAHTDEPLTTASNKDGRTRNFFFVFRDVGLEWCFGLALVPDACQLWANQHSSGQISRAQRRIAVDAGVGATQLSVKKMDR